MTRLEPRKGATEGVALALRGCLGAGGLAEAPLVDEGLRGVWGV